MSDIDYAPYIDDGCPNHVRLDNGYELGQLVLVDGSCWPILIAPPSHKQTEPVPCRPLDFIGIADHEQNGPLPQRYRDRSPSKNELRRAAFRLRHEEGWTYEAIGRALNVSTTTAWRWVQEWVNA